MCVSIQKDLTIAQPHQFTIKYGGGQALTVNRQTCEEAFLYLFIYIFFFLLHCNLTYFMALFLLDIMIYLTPYI